MRGGELGAEDDPSASNVLSDQDAVLQHLAGGQGRMLLTRPILAMPDKVRSRTRSRVQLSQGQWETDCTTCPRSTREAEMVRSVWETGTNVKLETDILTKWLRRGLKA